MSENLRQTPLANLHASLGAKMTGFAGYSMPLNYPDGVMKEHLWTRENAGLFDVSHMGQIAIRPLDGDMNRAARTLESLMPVNVLDLPPGRQRYGLLTNAAGGILDDLMIANRGDHFLAVVNAACKDGDFAHLATALAGVCEVEWLDRGLIALQGPRAVQALAVLAPQAAAMRFMDVAALDILGAKAIVTRSGYTGEDGFEISVAADRTAETARALLGNPAVKPVGLAARDSLRLEAGLCLYGHDMDTATTPPEASLDWAIPRLRRSGGARAGGFPGADVILAQLQDGPPRRRIGLLPEGRAPLREGAQLFATPEGGAPVGRITSGGFGPSLGAPVAMALVEAAHAAPDATLFGEVRGRRLPARVAPMPFVPNRYVKS